VFFIKDTYATVWGVQDVREKFSKVQISTSEKDMDGTRTWSNWFATFVSKAHQKVDQLQEKDRIKIISGKVNRISKKQDDGTWETYVNVYVFDFEMANDFPNNNPPVKNKESRQPEIEDSEEGELPF
jgi:chaperonin GroEL (HSP60 family)